MANKTMVIGKPGEDYILVPILFQADKTRMVSPKHEGLLVIQKDTKGNFCDHILKTFDGIIKFSKETKPHVKLVNWQIFLGSHKSSVETEERFLRVLPVAGEKFSFDNKDNFAYTTLQDSTDVTGIEIGTYFAKLAPWCVKILFMSVSSLDEEKLENNLYGIYHFNGKYTDPFPSLRVENDNKDSTTENDDKALVKSFNSLHLPEHSSVAFKNLFNSISGSRLRLGLFRSEQTKDYEDRSKHQVPDLQEIFKDVESKFKKAFMATDSGAGSSGGSSVASSSVSTQISNSIEIVQDVVQYLENSIKPKIEPTVTRTDGGLLVSKDITKMEPFATAAGTFSSKTDLNKLFKAVFQVQNGDSKIGTGFFISGDLFVTCYHVIYDCESDITETSNFKRYCDNFNIDNEVTKENYKFDSSAILYPINHQARNEIGLDIVILQIQRDSIYNMNSISLDFKEASQGWLNWKKAFKNLSQERKQSLFLVKSAGTINVQFTHVVEFLNWEVLYQNNTINGDSGSPLVNSEGKLMAIHRRGLSQANVGLRVDLLLHDIFSVSVGFPRIETIYPELSRSKDARFRKYFDSSMIIAKGLDQKMYDSLAKGFKTT